MQVCELRDFLAFDFDPTCQPITFVAHTIPDWKANRDLPEGNPFDFSNGRGKGRTQRVVKVARLNGMLGAAYGNCKRNRHRKLIDASGGILELPPIEIKPRQWGWRMPDCPLVEHTNKDGVTHHYLDFYPLRTLSMMFLLDGRPAGPVQAAQIAACVKRVNIAPGDIPWRNHRLDHIRKLKACKRLIEVE